MKKIKSKRLPLFLSVLLFSAIFMNNAKAYEHEVWESGGRYYWKTFDIERGNSTDLAVAVEGAMGSTGNRDVHILTGGTLRSRLDVIHPGVRLHCHNHTFTCDFTGTGISNNGRNGFEIYDLTLRNVRGGYGIRCSGASDLRFVNVKTIDIDWIGMRIDSRSSEPWTATIYNLYMRDCLFENCGSHGLETYSIDGMTLEGTMTARNCGDCGVLFNNSRNGSVQTVDSYNCCWGGGYAGLRYANACRNITTDRLYADHCGRGFFIVQSGPTENCHLNYAEIRECSGLGIWIESGIDCSVKGGCCESAVSVSGSGSYANVSSNCNSTGTIYQFQNRSTGQFIDGMGRTNNGDAAAQYGNTSHPNSQWRVEDAGSGYNYLVNVGTGMKLDGYGRTGNGDVCAQYESSTTHPNAQWRFVDAGSGYVFIENRGTGMRLDGYGWQVDGRDLVQYNGTTHPNAQWQRISLKSAFLSDEEIDEKENHATHECLVVYPNPVDDGMVQMQVPIMEASLVDIQLSNSLGQVVYSQDLGMQQEGNFEHSINVSELSKGIYIVSLKIGNETLFEKLMVE